MLMTVPLCLARKSQQPMSLVFEQGSSGQCFFKILLEVSKPRPISLQTKATWKGGTKVLSDVSISVVYQRKG